jgi:hypothetical protein
VGFTLEDFWTYGSSEYVEKSPDEAAGNALARSIALTAAALGDALVVALFAASRCRVERIQDQREDGLSYIVRVATPPAPFAVYLQRNDAEPRFEDRVRRYAGALLEEIDYRLSIAPALDYLPGWETALIEDYFRGDPGARENTEADTLNRLLKLT